jgi:hypothetical protein
VAIINPAIGSNSVNIQLQAPTTPKLYTEATVGPYWPAHVYVHSGTVTGPAVSLVTFSLSSVPSVYPGIVDLQIGNGFNDLVIDWTPRLHDPLTGIAQVDYQNIPQWFGGLQWHLQAAVLDLGQPNFLFQSTNVFDCQFQ